MSARRSLWLAALLAAAPAPAFAQEMCAALDRIEAASREPVPFASIMQAGREGTLVPGFREGECGYATGSTTAIVCWRRIAGESLSVEAMERTLRDCLGRAPVLRPDRQPRAWGEPDLVFTRRGLRYEFMTQCTPQCAAGMLAWLAIKIERPGR
jgi:hypothetical protein